MKNPEPILKELRSILGPDALLTDRAARHVYSRDASHFTLGEPCAVALPRTTDQVVAVVRACDRHGTALVCRGSGTGLSGGAVTPGGAVVLSLARLNAMGDPDPVARSVRVGPGVLNEHVSAVCRPFGLYFAPDPSSQIAATIGGNIAVNAGGPHCLRHGVTLPNLARLEWVDHTGMIRTTGRGLPAERGFDWLSLLTGSEGTLGVVVGADLRLLPVAESVRTLLAFFPRLDEATAAVVRMLGEGAVPVAVEMVDQAMLRAIEEAFGFGFSTEAEAAMIVEFEGASIEVQEDATAAREILLGAGADEVRLARDAAERLELWKCRKKAFGAVGRLAPSYVTMDVVVPLGALTGLVRQIQEIKRDFDVEVATAFHAGDGNLHPGVHFDDRDPDSRTRAHAAADRIIQTALAAGGSITGEHGVGIEKIHALPWQMDAVSLDLQNRIKSLMDPAGIFNPGKLFPDADAGAAATKPVPAGMIFDWPSLTVTAAADVPFHEIQQRAIERGFWIPIGWPVGPLGLKDWTVGDQVAQLLTGPSLLTAGSVRDHLLEIWATTGDDRPFHAGAPVFKNVAGLDLVHSLCGSGRALVNFQAASFQLKPVPSSVAAWRCRRLGPETILPDDVARLLHERGEGLGPSTLILDHEPDAGTLRVMACGRDTDWDLRALSHEITDACARRGWKLEDQATVRFGEAGLPWLEAFLPSWVFSSPEWTAITRGTADGPGPRDHLPDLSGRWIHQSAPRISWSPESRDVAPGWYADTVVRDGAIQPLPEPDVDLLLYRGLKRIFDPECRLDVPEWSKEDRDD